MCFINVCDGQALHTGPFTSCSSHATNHLRRSERTHAVASCHRIICTWLLHSSLALSAREFVHHFLYGRRIFCSALIFWSPPSAACVSSSCRAWCWSCCLVHAPATPLLRHAQQAAPKRCARVTALVAPRAGPRPRLRGTLQPAGALRAARLPYSALRYSAFGSHRARPAASDARASRGGANQAKLTAARPQERHAA